MKDAERYRLEPCPVCQPFWVATRTYTARCTDGKSGDPVRVTRQYKSTISLNHAHAEALRLAKEEAEAQIVCTWNFTACIPSGVEDPPEICVEYKSMISFVDAQQQAIKAAWAEREALV